jgi:hypothetical protein
VTPLAQTFEKDTEPYSCVRDAHVAALAKAAGVEVRAVHGHTLWDADA